MRKIRSVAEQGDGVKGEGVSAGTRGSWAGVLEEFGDFALEFVLSDSEALLEAAQELVLFAFDESDVLVGELPVLLQEFPAGHIPSAFGDEQHSWGLGQAEEAGVP